MNKKSNLPSTFANIRNFHGFAIPVLFVAFIVCGSILTTASDDYERYLKTASAVFIAIVPTCFVLTLVFWSLSYTTANNSNGWLKTENWPGLHPILVNSLILIGFAIFIAIIGVLRANAITTELGYYIAASTIFVDGILLTNIHDRVKNDEFKHHTTA